MSKNTSPLALLAQYADICRDAAKYLDPEERAKCVAEWFGKLPANQQQLVNDLAPYAQNVARLIRERRGNPVVQMPERRVPRV